MATSASGFLAIYEAKLRRELRGRDSILPWRRSRAYRACLTLIRAREAVCDLIPDPWELKRPPPPPPPPRTIDPTYAHR